MRRTFEIGLVLALLLGGCGEETNESADGGAQDSGGGAQDSGGGAQDSGGGTQEKVGTFTVRLVAPTPASNGRPATTGHATIGGTVFSAPQPQETIWELDMEQGDCSLLTPRVPFCETVCEEGVCVEDDQCQASPVVRDVGTLTVSGLKTSSGASEFQVKSIAGSYSTPGDVSLPHPPFAEGDEVRVKAAGAASVQAFELTGKGIAPLELTTSAFPLRAGMPLALAWKVPAKPELGRIEIKLDISHHGGAKGKVECNAEDTGSLEIAAGLITRLLNLGVAGFPTITVARVNRGSAQTSTGKVELQLVSDLERGVDIEGLASCSDSSECEAGKTCQADLTCK
jgi:hypothetical protein